MSNRIASDLTIPIFIVLLIVIGLFILAPIVSRKYREKHVLEDSVRLAALQNLNGSFAFRRVDHLLLRRALPSIAQFQRFNPDAFVLAAIGEDRGHYEAWVKDAEYNEKLRVRYEEMLTKLPASSYEKESWRKTEEELFNARRFSFDEAPTLELIWSYTSPAGRNSSHDMRVYSVEYVKKMLAQSTEQQYDREDRQAAIARERALMTDSLRYDVLKRDGFRCVICGSTAADGEKLEIDHIIPVSKGGKTELSNLQTLCTRCNRGKRDKL